jgi:hypothetical protein
MPPITGMRPSPASRETRHAHDAPHAHRPGGTLGRSVPLRLYGGTDADPALLTCDGYLKEQAVPAQ